MSTTARVWVRPTFDGHRVTTLELFFDLVFVFAITQITQFMAIDLSWRSCVRGLIMMAVLWFAWCSYSWLGNQAKADEGVVRVALLVAMGALFAAALAIPDAWDSNPAGLNASLVVAVAMTVVRIGHLVVYWVAAGDDKGLQRQLALTAIPVVLSCTLLFIGSLQRGSAQTAFWAAALLVDYTGIYVVGANGWRLVSAAHFAERYGLIVLIALGESIVAVGLGVTGAITWPVLMAALLALLVTICLWWAYFDVVALVAERVLHAKAGVERSRMGRDSYTYLHFPMVVGVIFMALGFKKVLEYVSDTSHYGLHDALHGIGLYALYGGVALYLFGHVAFRLRNVRSVNKSRFLLAVVLIALIPVANHLPALASLGLLAGVLLLETLYEVWRFSDARGQVRHAKTIVTHS